MVSCDTAAPPRLAEMRLFSGREAMADLLSSLAGAGLPPAPNLSMDLEYLAAGHEGEHPQAVVGFEQGRPIGYLPFVVRRAELAIRVSPRSALTLPYRQLRILGYLGAPQAQPADLLRFACDAAGKYHLGRVAEMQYDNSMAAAMLSWRPRDGGPRVACGTHDSYRVEINGSFNDFLRTRLSSKSRYNALRTLRLFDEAFQGVNVRSYTDAAAVPDFLRDAEAVARRSYQWAQRLPVVASDADEIARLQHLARRGIWRAYLLYARGTPCAYCSGFVYNRVYDYQTVGYDERYADYSPGTVLLLSILEDLFKAQLANELDFGAGPCTYKRHFATRRARVVYASLFPSRAYTVLLRGAGSSSNALVAAAKTLLRRGRTARCEAEANANRDEIVA